jgi:CDP-glucose 4,6-dehydratase
MTGPPGYKGTSVLVTGAQGFMGSWLVERLLASGARVIVPRRPAAAASRFAREGLEDACELVDLDLHDPRSVLRVLNEGEVRVVYHLAAQTIVATANGSPMATFDTNVRGTYNLLEATRSLAAEAPRLVVASSYHAYGPQADGACSETTPLRATSPYAASKACADFVARSYAATYGLPVAVTRLANIYGGGDLNWSRIVPDTVRALVRGDQPVIASDGTPERDYLYVEDAVDAYLAVADSLTDPANHGRAWNAGSDRPVSVLALVQALTEVAGSELEPEIRGIPVAGRTDRQYLDSSAIRDELGWRARRGLEDGLAATYEWYEQALREAALR